MPNDLANALPPRPIAVQPPPATSPLTSLGLLVLLLGLLGGLLAWLGPDLVRDWRIRDGAVAAEGARIEEARCHAWLQLLRFCDITVVDERDAGGGKRWLRYAFIASAERPFALQRSRADASLLTTDLGLEMFPSRVITLALFCAVPIVCIGVAAVMQASGRRAQRAFAAMSGQRLTPVIVEIESNNLVPPRRRLWAYLYDGDAGKERAVVEWPARDRPMFTSDEERWAVALRGEHGGAPLLLDAGLTCLDLTDAERAAFRDACSTAFAGSRMADSA